VLRPLGSYAFSSASSSMIWANDDDSSSITDENSDYAHFMTDLLYHVKPLPLQQEPSTHISNLLSTEQEWKDWHYSFSMNGFTDFLPQFNDHISCMAIDLNDDGDQTVSGIFDGVDDSGNDPLSEIESTTRLPWQYGDGFDDVVASSSITNVASNQLSQILATDGSGSIDKAINTGYDCIIDGGVMNGILSTLPSTVTWHSRTGPPALLDLVKLLNEASKAIRELGIYVSITNEEVPDYAKQYLDAMGEMIGMEWSYDLDGLSKEGYHVSVARKYFAGGVNFDPFSGNKSDDNDTNLLTP